MVYELASLMFFYSTQHFKADHSEQGTVDHLWTSEYRILLSFNEGFFEVIFKNIHFSTIIYFVVCAIVGHFSFFKWQGRTDKQVWRDKNLCWS